MRMCLLRCKHWWLRNEIDLNICVCTCVQFVFEESCCLVDGNTWLFWFYFGLWKLNCGLKTVKLNNNNIDVCFLQLHFKFILLHYCYSTIKYIFSNMQLSVNRNWMRKKWKTEQTHILPLSEYVGCMLL